MKSMKFIDSIKENNQLDKDLEDIRHYKGTLSQFKDYWERKMKIPFNADETVSYEYPKKRQEVDKSLSYQDFIDGQSSSVRYDLKNRRQGLNKNNENFKTMGKLIETYQDFLNELLSYDEQDPPPVSSYRSQDYIAKDNLSFSTSIIEEILKMIADGEQLEKEQLDLVSDIYNKLQTLKRSIQNRVELRSKQLKKLEDEQNFGK